MRAFVTGSTGLLGYNLVQTLLAAGHEVRALARSVDKAETLYGNLPGLTIVPGDMEDVAGFAEALADCDVLFHTAAFFREYFLGDDDRERLHRINVEATGVLMAAAAERGIRRVVHVSSSATIGHRPGGGLSDETCLRQPDEASDLYGRSKILSDREVLARSAALGLSTTLILPGWMFGPGDLAPTSSGKLVQDFVAGKLPVVPPGSAHVVDARDVAAAMLRAVADGRPGERYVVAGEHLTIGEIVQVLTEVTGKPAPKVHLPFPVAMTVAWFSELQGRLTGQPVLVSREGLRVLHRHPVITSAKAERELGATFRPLADTLRDELAWYRAPQPRSPRPLATV